MRIFLPISLALGLCFSLMLLFPRGAPTTLHAQSADPAPITTTAPFSTTATTSGAADRHFYLPLIQDGTDQIKAKSGIHLGNRFSSDWRIELFAHITGTTGTWPSAVVIQSDQVYNLYRYSTDECRIVAAGLKLTGEGEPYNVYKYLTAAAKAGTQVVIRITPSPGNFVDYADPGALPHTLLNGEEPAGGDYCGNANKHYSYRDVRDIAEEMNAIHQVNIDNGWPPGSFFFEPANEPNQEWYNVYKQRNIIVDPPVDDKQAWIDMDNYFAALYDTAKAITTALQILSPSISQELYGEQYELATCTEIVVQGDSQERSGIDFMKQTFGYDPDAADSFPDPKADGFAWHNYWRAGYEAWQVIGTVPTMDVLCATNPATRTLHSDHFIQYLSAGMAHQIGRRPTFITEADMKSPCQLDEAGTAAGKDTSPEAIRDSLLSFIEEESLARHVIAWLLINQDPDEAATCKSPDENGNLHANHNYEQNWHEAYGEDANRVYERAWFPLWWQAAW